MTDLHLSFDPYPTVRGKRRGRARWIVRLTALGVVLALAGYAGIMAWNPFGCGDGLTKLDGECIGVNDGSYVFDEALRAVQEKIEAENDSIGDRPYVRVALVLPLTAGNVPIERIRSQVEGAYVAQQTANASDPKPRIKLVLANKGSREQAGERVAEQLVSMTEEPDHLVAVVGLGLSSHSTANTAKVLSRNNIPMIGAVITADELNTDGSPQLGGRIPGLTRVNSTVRDQLTLIAGYLKEHRPDLRTAMLVSDSNPADLYTSSLRTNFSMQGRPMAAYWRAGGSAVQPYDGVPGSPGINAQFEAIVSNLCGTTSPDMVFYAGRAALLPNFLESLRRRTCERDRTITVVTGSDASALATRLPAPQELDFPVSVIFAPQASPAALSEPRWNPDVNQYKRFERSFVDKNGFPRADLNDGWAMTTHDAMLAATTAIQRATLRSTELPAPTVVRGVLYILNSERTSIPGAAGTFAFHSTRGDVTGRRLPVMELRPDGKLSVLGVYDQPVRR